MPNVLQVQTTVDSREAAHRLAQSLVENRLAACVQILGPITSTYRWHGAVETAQEWLCLIKTTQDEYSRLEEAVLALHSYQVPEILATPISAGLPAYLEWIAGEIG